MKYSLQPEKHHKCTRGPGVRKTKAQAQLIVTNIWPYCWVNNREQWELWQTGDHISCQ